MVNGLLRTPLPISPSPEEAPPATAVHNCEQFGSNRALISGCVSGSHHIFAVLEETGKLYFLPLDAHENGGIYSPETTASELPASLSQQRERSPTCLRFVPSGNLLFAVDPKGSLIVFEFETCPGLVRLASPSDTFRNLN